MKRTPLLLAAAVLAAIPAAVPAGAVAKKSSEPAPAKATFVGKVKSHGDYSTVHVRYTCHAGQSLWIAVKQNAAADKSTDFSTEGSSSKAAAYQHSHRNAVTCDGKTRTAKFTMDKVEWGWGEIQKGDAWVQFCLSYGDESEGGLEIYELGWVDAR